MTGSVHLHALGDGRGSLKKIKVANSIDRIETKSTLQIGWVEQECHKGGAPCRLIILQWDTSCSSARLESQFGNCASDDLVTLSDTTKYVILPLISKPQ